MEAADDPGPEDDFLAEMQQSLERVRRWGLAPASLGLAISAMWLWDAEELNLLPFLVLSVSLALSCAVGWLGVFALDARFLPQVARLRGLAAHPHVASPHRLLPEGLLRLGRRQLLRNTVSGHLAGLRWQAGFLEANRFEMSTGSTRMTFRGQLVQLETPWAKGRAFVLCRSSGRGLFRPKLTPRGFQPVAEFADASGRWELQTPEADNGRDRAELLRRCEVFLAALPPPVAGAQILGVVSSQGWLQLICANRQDLFGFGAGFLRPKAARALTERAFANLIWVERVARALAEMQGASVGPRWAP